MPGQQQQEAATQGVDPLVIKSWLQLQRQLQPGSINMWGGLGDLERESAASPTLAPALESSEIASGSTTPLPCVRAWDYSDMSDPDACSGELQRGSKRCLP